MRKLNIVSGNILDYLSGIDAIVNSANKYMTSGSGVSGAIYKAANKEKLEAYCKENYRILMKTNEVRITPGFDLGIDIIHIYTPKFLKEKEPIKMLLDAYSILLKVASEKGYKNIVTVSLGTGVHGYKHEDVAKPVLGLIKDYLKHSDASFSITLVLSTEDIRDLYINYLN